MATPISLDKVTATHGTFRDFFRSRGHFFLERRTSPRPFLMCAGQHRYAALVSADLTPFTLIETSPGKFSLLLQEFEPASEVFEAAGSEGGGYAWEAVARHLVENDATNLQERLAFDPEASMFCAYGDDRAALAELGARLARLFHDHRALATVVESIGPNGFD